MTVELPPELVTLLSSAEPVVREGAWATLVLNHHAALLHAARSLGGGVVTFVPRASAEEATRVAGEGGLCARETQASPGAAGAGRAAG